MSDGITACRRCGVSVTGAMRFCPSCGASLAVRSAGFYRAVAGTTLVVFGLAVGLRYVVQPPRPELIAGSGGLPQHAAPEVNDPQLEAMRKEVDASPDDLGKLRVFAGMLGDKLRANPDAPQGLVFEAIDALSRILKAEPNDPGALVMMADLSFDQKAFTKAVDFYQRYLKLEPNDLGARARYASTLTFLGKYADSVSELNAVLAKDPKNFPAMAYLAITYAQSGDLAKAKEMGASALKAAPSEDARARFSTFVESLDEGPVAPARRGAPEARGGAQTAQPQAGIEGFVAVLRANPVAGPKFVSYELGKPNTIRLLFRNFPMQQMPPFAKEKFFSGLKKAAKDAQLDGVTTLLFVDIDSGAEMESLSLQ